MFQLQVLNHQGTKFNLVMENQLTQESAIAVTHFLSHINGWYADLIDIYGPLNPLLFHSVMGKPLQLYAKEAVHPFISTPKSVLEYIVSAEDLCLYDHDTQDLMSYAQWA